MKRLSAREEEIIYWLAIEREAIALSDLQENIITPPPKGELQEALRSLRRRQLIEMSATGFILQPVIMEYLTDCLVDQVCEEIRTGQLLLFVRHALLKAQAKEYIRQSQCRLILQPLLQQLLAIFGKEALEQRFQSLLATLHARHDYHTSYAAGNVLNVLVQMGCVLRGYDFSRLMVRQAYLQGINLQDVNFAYADFAKSVFTDTFGSVLSVALSPNGKLLAAGMTNGGIRLWQATDGTPLFTYEGHTDWVRSITFSPDSSKLVSGSEDQTIRIWEISTGNCLKVLRGHSSWIRAVVFSPDGTTLASGSEDQTVRLWDVKTGRCIRTLLGNINRIYDIAFHPSGDILASGSHDGTIRLWNISTEQNLRILKGHTNLIYSVAFDPTGAILASGSREQIRLWNIDTEQCLRVLHGHTGWVYTVSFSPDGMFLASGSDDKNVRLWNVNTGQCLKCLQEHTDIVWSVAFSLKGDVLSSGSSDGTLKLWDLQTGICLNTLRGDRPYERMNITQVKGLTEGQKATLRSLGAIENE